MTLTLIRHSECQANVDRLVCGQMDSPLTATGRQLAIMASKFYRKKTYDVVYSSDLKRAKDTAQLLFGAVDVREDAALREMDFGTLASLQVDLLRSKSIEYKKIGGHPDHVFCSGESLRGFNDRVEKFIDGALVKNASGNHAIVAHGGVINLLLMRLMGVELQKFPLFEIDHCAYSEVQIDDGRVFIKSINAKDWESLG